MSLVVQAGEPLANLGQFTVVSSAGGLPSFATLGAMRQAGLNPAIDPDMGRGVSAQFGLANAGLAMKADGGIAPAAPAAPAVDADARAPTVIAPVQSMGM